VIEVSLLGPGAVGTHLADLGADVIKVEPPKGDYIRAMTWPIIEGSSLLHWHIHRGKRSITLDLRSDEGKEVFLDLVKDADAVIEAMRPGALAKRGLGFEDLLGVNPKIVFCTISGYGMSGPAQPRHRVRHLGGSRETRDRRERLSLHPRASLHRHPRRSALRRLRPAGRRAEGP
jgi:crotonobetainyl-CoA:carnitine CoA-transferase CaiB-like acyl-CoA transferase